MGRLKSLPFDRKELQTMMAILATIGAIAAMNLGIVALHEIAMTINVSPAWIESLYNWMLSLYGLG